MPPHPGEADLLELLLHALAHLAGGEQALLPQGEGHVVVDRHGVEEGAALEDHAVAVAHPVQIASPEPGDVDAVHHHRARVGPQQADQVLEQHRLAAAATPDHHHDLAGGDVEIEAAQDRLGAEALAESLHPDHGRTDPRK
jgi:capsid protein